MDSNDVVDNYPDRANSRMNPRATTIDNQLIVGGSGGVAYTAPEITTIQGDIPDFDYLEVIAFDFEATGGSGTYEWTVDVLPDTLVLDTDGHLHGTVTDSIGLYTIVVRCTDTVSTLYDEESYTLTIVAVEPPTFFLAANCTLHSKVAIANLTISDTDKADAWVNDGTANTDWVGTTTARPTYSATSLGGKPGLTTDGSNDCLTNALRANQVLGTVADDGAFQGTVAAIVYFSALPSVGTRRDFLSVPTGGYGPLQVRNVGGQGSIVYERSGLVALSRNINAATPYLVIWRDDGAGTPTMYLSVNGGTETSSSGGDPGGQTGTLQCGGDGGNAGFAVCTIGEVWISKATCSTQDIADLLTYAQAEWGVA